MPWAILGGNPILALKPESAVAVRLFVCLLPSALANRFRRAAGVQRGYPSASMLGLLVKPMGFIKSLVAGDCVSCPSIALGRASLSLGDRCHA